jgi:Cft2 family RNA processing exonuclease
LAQPGLPFDPPSILSDQGGSDAGKDQINNNLKQKILPIILSSPDENDVSHFPYAARRCAVQL